MEPDSGDVLMHGESVAHAPLNKRNIGMVFQDYALFPHMSVAENVAFPLLARGCDRRTAASKVEAMLEVVGLAGFGPRSIRQMSGGQSQRVALARALVFGPELVLLDEPMAALDKKLRGSMQTEILRIVKQLGATVISVTHDQEEALVMSDRIALFENGRLVQIGTPQELYERPSTSFVADFIGEANILSGTVGAGGTLMGAGWRCTAPAHRLGPPGQRGGSRSARRRHRLRAVRRTRTARAASVRPAARRHVSDRGRYHRAVCGLSSGPRRRGCRADRGPQLRLGGLGTQWRANQCRAQA